MRFLFLPTWMLLMVLGAADVQAQASERAQEKIMQQPRSLSAPSTDGRNSGAFNRMMPPANRSPSMMPRNAPPRSQFQRAKSRNNNRLRDSVRSIERDTGGRVLRAESFSRGGNEMHRVKVLTPDGRVRIMQNTARPQPEVIVHPVQTPELDMELD